MQFRLPVIVTVIDGVIHFGFAWLIPGALRNSDNPLNLPYGHLRREFQTPVVIEDVNQITVRNAPFGCVAWIHDHGLSELILKHRNVVELRVTAVQDMRSRKLHGVAAPAGTQLP